MAAHKKELSLVPKRKTPQMQWPRCSEVASRIQHGRYFLTVKFQIGTTFLERRKCEDFESEINISNKEQPLFFQTDEVLRMH